MSVPALLYYSFDVESINGTTLANLGTGGSAYNTRLYNGTAVSTTDTKVGSAAVHFSSSAQNYIQIPSVTFGGSAGMTVAFWFKFTSTALFSAVFDFGNGPATDNWILGDDSTDLWMAVYKGTTYYHQFSKFQISNANDNTWRHFAWTINSAGNWVQYKNGAVANTYSNACPLYVTRLYNYLGKRIDSTQPYL